MSFADLTHRLKVDATALGPGFTVEIPGYLERGAMAVEPPFPPL